MQYIQNYWKNFKFHPDQWFFYGFLGICTLSIRKILFLHPIGGQFNEYTSIYLYLSDILLILVFFGYGYSILYNNYHFLSNMFSRLFVYIYNVPRGTLFFLPLLLVIWSFISLFWAENTSLALFKSLKLAIFYFLYLYILIIVPRGTIIKNILWIMVGLGVIHSLIGVWQFIIQHSIGLFWLHESVIGPNMAGVAKIVFSGEKLIRVYGLFPHPNVFGGFLLISIIFTWTYYKMFHVEHLRNRLKIALFLSIQFLALLTTFSKSAIFGLLISLSYILYTNVPRGTFRIEILKKMFHVEHLWRKVILILGIITVFAFLVRPDTNSLFFKSLNERLLYLHISYKTIRLQPLIGVGSGQFVNEMRNNYSPLSNSGLDETTLHLWQYQPVHNVFLLIWSELGIIGLIIFVWWLWSLFYFNQSRYVPRGTYLYNKAIMEQKKWLQYFSHFFNKYKLFHVEQFDLPQKKSFSVDIKISRILRGILLGLAFIMLFDHYLWDIQQGQILLWLIIGLNGGLAIKTGVDELSIDKK